MDKIFDFFSQGNFAPLKNKLGVTIYANDQIFPDFLSKNSTRGFLGYYLHRTVLPATAVFEKAGHI